MSLQDDGHDLFENFKDLHLKKKKLMLVYRYTNYQNLELSDFAYDIGRNVKQNLEHSLLNGKDVYAKMCVTVKTR